MTAPLPVPALPDTERRTAYAIASQTGPFNVAFALYGDSTDYGSWVEVWLNGVQLTAIAQWTLSSPSGNLGLLSRPITDATVTLVTASTGTLEIVGARRPRRTTQFSENQGVAARDVNQAVTDIVAMLREVWDRMRNRMISAPAGETLTQLPPAATRANKIFLFDGNGNPDPTTLTITGSIGAIALNLTRSQIPSVTVPYNTIIVSGYAAAGDLGVGATYTSNGAGAGSPMAIQDAAGTWYMLVTEPSINVGACGAIGNGTTDDAASINNALVLSGIGLTVLPSETYSVSGITTQPSSNLIGNCSILKPHGNTQTVVTVDGSLTLQTGQFQLLHDFVIDGTGKTAITGMAGTITGTTPYMGAATIIDNVSIINCDTNGFYLGSTQFLRTSSIAAYLNGGAGILIVNDAALGGGNSQDHYQPHLVSNDVGIFADGTKFGGISDLNFYNAQLLSNGVCGAAFFQTQATFYGGAPENNGAGAATITVEGKTVKRSSMYLNNSTIHLENYTISEATITPCILLENSSILNAHNMSGYGNPSGTLIQADAGSICNFSGSFRCIGLVENVGAWPDAFAVMSSGSTVMYGQPVLEPDLQLAPLFAAQAPVLTAAAVTPPTITYVEDAALGYCPNIVYAASAGSTNANHGRIAVGTGGASKNSLYSFLIKSSVDCVFGFTTHDGTTYNILAGTIALKAGVVTRVIGSTPDFAAGTNTIFFYPTDTTGPTVQVSNLQFYQGAKATAAVDADIAKIVRYGSFSPGVTRATAANIGDKTHSVNVNGKYPGKQIWDSDGLRVLFSGGPGATDVWKDGVNSTVITPA